MSENFSDEGSLRLELCATYRELERLGLSSGSAGNVSARWGEGMLISPAGATGANITPECFVRTALDGAVSGAGRPSSEWAMHADIYRRKAAAWAVIHAHPDACVALSCQRRAIPAFHYMIASYGGNDVPCSEYAPFGSLELAIVATDALKDRTACLLANHGMICHAKNLSDALANALKLEVLARQYILSLQIGPPVILTSEEMAVVRERYKSYGR
ncbi:class II aldolase/adducin family protein [Methylocapsa sp. S129]|uniref:class II aldolase/adducin family protein n=1 Tax=Methylocapsa sp. S129 TaxID=1641869 RepID=UPI00131C5B8B|nr:class II aldolase/adducin family protein [Methylocapsa sp. S129]